MRADAWSPVSLAFCIRLLIAWNLKELIFWLFRPQKKYKKLKYTIF